MTTSIRAQCPEKEVLYEKISYLRDSSKLPIKEKLTEALGYLNIINNCPYRNDSTHASFLRFIGYLCATQSDYFTAIQYYRESINIINSNTGKPSINPAHLIRSYFWLFAYYDSLNNVQEKMKAVSNFISIAYQLKSSSSIEFIRALYTRVKYYFDIGDFHKCIEDAKECERLSIEYGKNRDNPNYLLGKQFASSSLGWHIQALLQLKNFETAEQLLSNKADEYTKTGLTQYLGMIYGQMAEVQLYKGAYKKALLYFNKTLEYEQKAKSDFNYKQTLNAIGYNLYFKQLNDPNTALLYFKKALAFTNKNKSLNKVDSFESMNILGHIANIYVQQAHYDSAFIYFQLAFNQIQKGINETYFLKNSSEEIKSYKKIHYLTGLILDKGDAFRKKFTTNKQSTDAEEALRIYKVADHMLNRIKTEQSDLDSKLFWRSDNRRLYEHAIDACYLRGNKKDAFYFFEKSRAVLLNDQLTAQQYLGTDDILKQVQVKKKIINLERELTSMVGNSKKYEEIEQTRFELAQELDRLEQSIKVNNPLYYQSTLDTSFITIQDVQNKLLNNHQALLEIFSGDSAVYTLLITPKNVYLNKVSKSDFDATTNSYISYISNPDLMNKDFRGFTRTANHLYKLIFDKNPVPTGRIIISPDGRYFPFEALVINESSSPVYFLNDHAVSYTYSARYLQNNFISNASVAPAGYFLGIAPVKYAADKSLATLNASDLSLNKINGFMENARSLVGRQASRENFLKQFSSYKIIQLYTHASDSSNQNEPVIYFADAPLYLSELLPEKRPSTQLIVLSACETGIGKLYHGEGIFSFNRGFAAFGVPSSISNLWAVDDLATYRLTELFYKYLSAEMPVDIALQKAKLEFLKTASKQQTLPYYWAATVLVGKTDPIQYDRPSNWTIPVLITGIAGLLLFAGWRRYSRRKKVVIDRKKLIPV